MVVDERTLLLLLTILLFKHGFVSISSILVLLHTDLCFLIDLPQCLDLRAELNVPLVNLLVETREGVNMQSCLFECFV